MEKYIHYHYLADLFRYPDENFEATLEKNRRMLGKCYPEACDELEVFVAHVLPLSMEKRQELYTKTFDVQPICYLDLGYVIFKEDYKRGAFLVKMQGEQQKVGNDCGSDLPDNISNIFTLMFKSEDQKLLDELAVKVMIPGIKSMISEFAQARIALKIKVLKKLHKAVIQEDLNKENVYKNLFLAALWVLEKDFGDIHFETPEDKLSENQHHQSFFEKNSINKNINRSVQARESNKVFNNYKLD